MSSVIYLLGGSYGQNKPTYGSRRGICEYIAFGDKKFEIKNFVDFKKLEEKKDWDKYPAYQQAGAFFKFLSEKYGNNKIATFLKKLKTNSEEKAFKEIFGTFEKIQKDFFSSFKNEKIISSGNSLR